MSLILAKLIAPNAINLDGFATPHTTVTSYTSVTQSINVSSSASANQSVDVTPSTSIAQCVDVPPSTSIAQSVDVTPSTSIAQCVDVTPSTSIAQSVDVTPSTSIVQSVDVTPSTSIAQSVDVTPSTSIAQSVDVTPSTSIAQSVDVPPSTSITQSVDVRQTAIQPTTLFPPTTTPECSHFETVRSVAPPCSNGVLDSEEIKAIKMKSCSRRNFAVKLARKLFDEGTRKQSNVHGKLGKLKLNPVLIDYIKSLCFQFYPLQESQTEKVEWGKCVIAVDESNRRLNNKPNKRQCYDNLDVQ